LWRGAPLAEFADTGFASPVITRLEEARLAAIKDRIEADLMLGGHVLEALQMPDVFSNEVISALTPEHTVDLLPQYLDPPQHTAMRRVLNRWFAPAVVRRLEPLVLSRCVELIEELRPRGGCDLVSDFAIRFPTDLFLATLNLPISDGNASFTTSRTSSRASPTAS
jgi:cytochrome P450